MVRILLVSIHLFLTVFAFGQLNQDSLEEVWKNRQVSVSERLSTRHEYLHSLRKDYPAGFVDQVNSFIRFSKQKRRKINWFPGDRVRFPSSSQLAP